VGSKWLPVSIQKKPQAYVRTLEKYGQCAGMLQNTNIQIRGYCTHIFAFDPRMVTRAAKSPGQIIKGPQSFFFPMEKKKRKKKLCVWNP
jgi:hypothetical protein